jgi:hypothetical protein
MAGFFTKLDAGITDSTIWHQPDHTRLTWITMLAMADQHGYVGASIPGLASRARVPLDACVAALECFKSPDEYSRTKDHDGRRIADADGGWVLLNHAKYRAAQNADDRRERSRLAMADLRARRKATSATPVNGYQSLTQLPQAEADNRSNNTEPTALVATASADGAAYRVPKCPNEGIVALYADRLPMLPQVAVLNDSRKRSIASRWREVCAADKFNETAGLEWFGWFFGHVRKSKFLTGNGSSRDGRTWKADFDWLLTPTHFARVVEGRYHQEGLGS